MEIRRPTTGPRNEDIIEKRRKHVIAWSSEARILGRISRVRIPPGPM